MFGRIEKMEKWRNEEVAIENFPSTRIDFSMPAIIGGGVDRGALE